jgi:Glycosyl transferases group 1
MIIFYINVIEENTGWGAEFFANRGFLNNGNQTITLDYRKNRYWLSNRFFELNQNFDLLFLQRGDGFPLELLCAVKRPCFFWASELVSRCRDQDRLFESRIFNHAFVRTQNCIDEIAQKGWMDRNNLSVLLSGFDEAVHFKINNIEKDIDILFVGSMLPRRSEWIESLSRHHSIRIEQAFGSEMVKLFNRAKIILNIHAEDYLDTETRVFEALGCGSFLLSEKLSKENPFTSGKHLVEAECFEDMAEKIHYYLKHDDEREAIANKGYTEALRKHTYTKRTEYISSIFLRYLDNSSSGSPIDRIHIYPYWFKEKFLRAVQIVYGKLTAIKDLSQRRLLK